MESRADRQRGTHQSRAIYQHFAADAQRGGELSWHLRCPKRRRHELHNVSSPRQQRPVKRAWAEIFMSGDERIPLPASANRKVLPVQRHASNDTRSEEHTSELQSPLNL